MGRVMVRGVGLSCRQTGKGPDVVFVHGLATTQAFWSLSLVSRLAARFRVTTFDLRGHGYSEMPAHGYTPGDMAGDLLGLLDELELDRVHLVGHSFGGLVALEATLAQPSRVASLVVADTRIRTLQPRQPLSETDIGRSVRTTFERQGAPIDEEEPEMGVRLLEVLAEPRWEGLRNRLGRQVQFVPFAGQRGGRRAASHWRKLLKCTTAGHDFRYFEDRIGPQLQSLRCPLLAMYGERSPNRQTGTRLVAAVPNAQLITVPDAGHFHPASRADFFRQQIERFLNDRSE